MLCFSQSAHKQATTQFHVNPEELISRKKMGGMRWLPHPPQAVIPFAVAFLVAASEMWDEMVVAV